MSRIQSSDAAQRKIYALLFDSLGNETRLSLVARLSHFSPQSISELAEDLSMSRQAATKHLQVLLQAGVVKSLRQGRERLYELSPEPIERMRSYLKKIVERYFTTGGAETGIPGGGASTGVSPTDFHMTRHI